MHRIAIKAFLIMLIISENIYAEIMQFELKGFLDLEDVSCVGFLDDPIDEEKIDRYYFNAVMYANTDSFRNIAVTGWGKQEVLEIEKGGLFIPGVGSHSLDGKIIKNLRAFHSFAFGGVNGYQFIFSGFDGTFEEFEYYNELNFSSSLSISPSFYVSKGARFRVVGGTNIELYISRVESIPKNIFPIESDLSANGCFASLSNLDVVEVSSEPKKKSKGGALTWWFCLSLVWLNMYFMFKNRYV